MKPTPQQIADARKAFAKATYGKGYGPGFNREVAATINAVLEAAEADASA